MLDISKAVLGAVSDQFGPENYRLDTSLGDFACDDLDLLEIIMGVESRLGVSLDETKFHERMTLGEFADEVWRQRRGGR